MVMAFILSKTFLMSPIRFQIASRIPINPLDRRLHSLSEMDQLIEFVVAPGRVTGFGDPDFAGEIVTIENGLDAAYFFAPIGPIEFPRAGKTVDAEDVDLIENAPPRHQVHPVWIGWAETTENRFLSAVFGPMGGHPDHFAKNLPLRIEPPIPIDQPVRLVPEFDLIEEMSVTADGDIEKIGKFCWVARRRGNLWNDSFGGRGIGKAGQNLNLGREFRKQPVVPIGTFFCKKISPRNSGADVFDTERSSIGQNLFHPRFVADVKPFEQSEDRPLLII